MEFHELKNETNGNQLPQPMNCILASGWSINCMFPM